MPNNLVFNNVAGQLQTTINGVDGGGIARPILTAADGRLDLGSVTVTAAALDIRPLTATDVVTVTATNFDIRPLTATDVVTVTATDFDIRPLTATDVVTVTAVAFDIRPLTATDVVTVTATDFDIRPLTAAEDSVELGARVFTETNTAIAGVVGTGTVLQTDTSQYSLYSFYVNNTGTAAITVQLQISPTTTEAYFVDDGSGPVSVAAGEKAVLVAKSFLRYTRVYYDSGAATATAEFYFNGQV
ncbi:DUF6385 domain-containing protein [Mahella sp.]|uniref:DUF6385 domain-containing protein n=1 Tax=Mahella sp. TaxID=2798721 RepID=UPI0025B9936F|nr:DUF6385 domain-containing protein [Mahella sp.]MBZ4666511.1 hypothetical protein [Mahella sp.]MDK2902304.1 hypothetical protein [Clostridiales bacterium]